MRLAIVSDIHGNIAALEAVEADLRTQAPDLVVQGGDLAHSGSSPDRVIDRIRELDWPGICGNTDEILWAPEVLDGVAKRSPHLQPMWSAIAEIADWSREVLGEERIGWLERLPRDYRYGPLALVHASPGDLWNAPTPEASDETLEATFGQMTPRIAVYGHIHRAFSRRCRNLVVANCGSVSLSYDGDRRAAYLLVDEQEVVVRRVEYELEEEVRTLAVRGVPHAAWVSQILNDGRYVPRGSA